MIVVYQKQGLIRERAKYCHGVFLHVIIHALVSHYPCTLDLSQDAHNANKSRHESSQYAVERPVDRGSDARLERSTLRKDCESAIKSNARDEKCD